MPLNWASLECMQATRTRTMDRANLIFFGSHGGEEINK
jgi:hypothetical protein